MPIYEYECPRCGKRFEKLQGMNERFSLGCPDCGTPARRLISAGAAMISRGSDYEVRRPKSNCTIESPCCGREAPCEKKPCDE
jgi:putative FmdB family regulatory protein